MAQNSAVVLTLDAVPFPEGICISNAQQLQEFVINYIRIAGLESLVAGAGFVTTNNTAAQALSVANAAKAEADALAAVQVKTRAVTAEIPLPTGDSLQSISFQDIGTTLYEVRVTLIAGASTHPAAYYGWRLLGSSRTSTSCQILFDNIPAGSSFIFVVQSLPNQ